MGKVWRRLIPYSLIIRSCLDPFTSLLSNRNANHLIINSFSLYLYLYICYFLFFIFLPSLKFYNASHQFKWHLLGESFLGPSDRKNYSPLWAPNTGLSIVMLKTLYSNSLFHSLPPLLDSSSVYLSWNFQGLGLPGPW